MKIIKIKDINNVKANKEYVEKHNLWNNEDLFEKESWKKLQLKNLTFDNNFKKLLIVIPDLNKEKIQKAFSNKEHTKKYKTELYLLKIKLIERIKLSIERDKRSKGLKFHQLLDPKRVDFETAQKNVLDLLAPFYFLDLEKNPDFKNVMEKMILKEWKENKGLKDFFSQYEDDKDLEIKKLKEQNRKLKNEIKKQNNNKKIWEEKLKYELKKNEK